MSAPTVAARAKPAPAAKPDTANPALKAAAEFTERSPLSAEQTRLRELERRVGAQIVGQGKLVNRLLIALLADGHLLVEGAPGLAKTRAIKVLSEGIEGDYHRVQFTPDLLPADLTGTDIYRPQEAGFVFQPGPLFNNLVLADELNRAPAKVQSALLEAMAERQITVGNHSYDLPALFLVMATQNPIEQEGVYALPEAQLDRFLLHVLIDYPEPRFEREILKIARADARHDVAGGTVAAKAGPGRGHSPGNKPAPASQSVASPAAKRAPNPLHKPAALAQADLFAARAAVLNIHMAANVEEYLLQLVLATRAADKYSEKLSSWVEYGASPRASIALDRCARAHAWLAGRDYVSPQDVQEMAADVMRHRLILNYEAEAEGITADRVIAELLSLVAVP